MARTPPLVTLPGSDEYGKFLDQLLNEARRRESNFDSRAGIVEFALNRLGREWGLVAPRRARPIGANQHNLTQPPNPED